MRGEQPDIALLCVADARRCSSCCDDLTNHPAIECAECEKSSVILCTSCFKLGAQAGEHLRGHNYTILDPVGPVVFDREGSNEEEWGCFEDLNLLSSFIKSHLDQWPERSKDSGRQRSIDEALSRIDKYFIQSSIGEYVLKELKKAPSKLAIDESESPELPPTYPPNAPQTLVENGYDSHKPLLPPLSLNLHDGKWSIPASPPHSPISDKRLPLLSRTGISRFDSDQPSTSRAAVSNGGVAFNFLEDEYEDSDSTRSSGEWNNSCNSPTKKGRRTSLSKSPLACPLPTSRSRPKEERENGVSIEGIPSPPVYDDEESRQSPLMQAAGSRGKGGALSEERMLELRRKYPNSYFYNLDRDKSNNKEAGRYDEEDLQLLAYMPRRDEFEHEYKNDAEQLISSVVSVRESAELDDSTNEAERFLNEVKLARIRRYNRILKARETKRNIIREHQLVAEYLSIAKNNLSERGRYNVMDDVKYFNSKQKEDFFKPLFFRLRQAADRKTIDQLAESIGKMETLKDQIDELRQLQREGVKELKGKLKVDALPGSWSRKRRIRRVENMEQRKAGLRWKRIKRWTKRQGVSTSEGASEEAEK